MLDGQAGPAVARLDGMPLAIELAAARVEALGVATAALAGYALRVAGQAAARLLSGGDELAAARWLDAEDATMRQVLGWVVARDPALALRLAGALGWWWVLRGRLACAGDLAEAERAGAAGLARAREAGDLWNQAALLSRIMELDLRAGRTGDAAAHLREGLRVAVRTGLWFDLRTGLSSARSCAPRQGVPPRP